MKRLALLCLLGVLASCREAPQKPKPPKAPTVIDVLKEDVDREKKRAEERNQALQSVIDRK